MTDYVVTRPFHESNVGSNLASLAGALLLARRLGRDLLVDWRGLTQLRDPDVNYFTEFFEHPPELLGTRVLYAPVAELEYSEGAEGVAWLSANEAGALSREPRAHEAHVLVLQQYHGPDRMFFPNEGERLAFLRRFYREIAPRPDIAAAVDGWVADRFDGSFVVAVNVRTGNGRYFARDQPYAGRVNVELFADRERFLAMIERACRARLRRAPRPWRQRAKIFYATDSAEMSELLARLPSSQTRRRVFPPPGTGDTFLFEGVEYTDRDSIFDTLVDMFLLARCDALVHNSSVFNQYARVVTGAYGGNLVHFETLTLRNRWRWVEQGARRRLSPRR